MDLLSLIAMTAMMELHEIQSKTNVSMFQNLKGPLIQAPIFMSFFFALRAMAYYPLESMKDEGLFWFKDLTVADPFYLLPLATSASLFAVLKMGIEFGNRGNTVGQTAVLIQNVMKYGLPPFVFVCMYSYPSAVLLYWCTNNFISVIQVYILNQPQVREYLKIPKVKKWSNEELGKGTSDNRGFVQGFKDTMDTMRSSADLAHKHRLRSAQNFERAGTGPLKKTYPLPKKRGDE